MTRFVGIDFGTSTTLIAVRENEVSQPQVIPIGLADQPWMPSVVATTSPQTVGERALEAETGLQVLSVKSGLTRGQDWINEQGGSIGSDAVRTLISSILAEAIHRAEAAYPDLFSDSRVFFGCPALWDFENRRTLADIANSFGLQVDVLNVLDEPIAAGVNWVKSSWVTNGEGVAGRTLVFDAGGGTLDVALIEVSGSETPEVSVLSANSLAKSGDDIDALIANHFLSMNSQFGLDAVAKKLLLEASKKLKEALSGEESASVQVGHPVSMNLSLTRVEVESIIKNQVEESLKIVDRVLVESELRKRADLSVAEIRKTSDQIALSVDNVLLVGGLSQMPIFRQRLQTKFPKAIVHSLSKPQLAVAEGLTYADAIVHLNMPRPPISFVIKPGLEGPEDVIYTAFAEIVDPIDAMRGNAYLKYQFNFTNYPEGDYEIFCVLPDRDMTVIPIRFLGASTEENGQCVMVTHSRRSPSESMEFMLYATGEFLVKGKNKCDTYRPLTWRRLSYGADMSEFRLELQIKSSKSWPDDMNDKSMSSKK